MHRKEQQLKDHSYIRLNRCLLILQGCVSCIHFAQPQAGAYMLATQPCGAVRRSADYPAELTSRQLILRKVYFSSDMHEVTS